MAQVIGEKVYFLDAFHHLNIYGVIVVNINELPLREELLQSVMPVNVSADDEDGVAGDGYLHTFQIILWYFLNFLRFLVDMVAEGNQFFAVLMALLDDAINIREHKYKNSRFP